MVSLDKLIEIQESQEEGDFKALDDLLIPMDTAVSRLPFVTINDAERNRFDNGQSVKGTCSEALGEGVSYRVYHGDDTSGIFLGVGEGVLDPKDQGIPKQEVFVNPKRRVVYPS
jgi:tRNA pseudouridine55 synthase